MRSCRLLAAVLLAVLAPTTVLGAGSTPLEAIVPLSITMDGRITVRVRVNGSQPYRFRLDTGASRTVITTRLARQLGLQPDGASRTVTQSGDTRLALVHLASLQFALGPELPPVTAAIVAEAALDPALRIDGLLGQDALREGPYSIDYRSAQLTLGTLAPASPTAIRLPLLPVAGSWLALVPGAGGGRSLRMLPDSGADRIVLFAATSDHLPPMTILESVRVRSIAGDRAARLVRLHAWQVGNYLLRDREALWMEQPAAGGAMGDGLLPLQLFARASFHVAGRYLELEPDAQ